jgi:hypothetical protein
MKIEITIDPEPNGSVPIQLTLLRINEMLAIGSLSGRFTITHSYIATGHQESDDYHVDWGILHHA